jgi:hypothetical protein
VTHIAHEILEPGQATLIAKHVHRVHGARRLDPCRPQGIVFNAAPAGVLRRQFQVQPELLFEVAVAPTETQRSPETVAPLAKDVHVTEYHFQH